MFLGQFCPFEGRQARVIARHAPQLKLQIVVVRARFGTLLQNQAYLTASVQPVRQVEQVREKCAVFGCQSGGLFIGRKRFRQKVLLRRQIPPQKLGCGIAGIIGGILSGDRQSVRLFARVCESQRQQGKVAPVGVGGLPGLSARDQFPQNRQGVSELFLPHIRIGKRFLRGNVFSIKHESLFSGLRGLRKLLLL